jgi:hypothetical protein
MEGTLLGTAREVLRLNWVGRVMPTAPDSKYYRKLFAYALSLGIGVIRATLC